MALSMWCMAKRWAKFSFKQSLWFPSAPFFKIVSWTPYWLGYWDYLDIPKPSQLKHVFFSVIIFFELSVPNSRRPCSLGHSSLLILWTLYLLLHVRSMSERYQCGHILAIQAPADECTEVCRKSKSSKNLQLERINWIICMLTVNETESSRAEALCVEGLKELV